jgi:hypothetical protein
MIMNPSEEENQLAITDTELIVATHGKWSKTEASYVDSSSHLLALCSNCRFFSEGQCSVIDGDINAEGYCKLWQPVIPVVEVPCLEELSQDMKDKEVIEVIKNKENKENKVEELLEVSPNTFAQGVIFLSSSCIKVPLAKKGKWKHDVYGEVEFTDRDFEEIVSNLKGGILGHPPYLTFGHLDEESHSTDSHRKRGDIQDISVEGDVLYGLFDQRDEVVSAVSNKEYEYASGEFLRNFTDKESGEKKGTVFMRVALTNSPFLPFSKDEKVQLLSSQESLEGVEGIEATSYLFPSVISLSMNDILNTSDVEVPEIIDITHTQEQEPMPNVDVEKVGETLPVVEEVVAPKPVAQALSLDITAIASLIDKVKLEVAGTYQAQLDSAISIIQGLKEDLSKVNVELSSQKEVTQAYSLNMSRAQEENLNNSLLGAGVPPALINTFSTVRKAIETKDSTVKLSQGGAEQDVSIVQALSQLLVDAVNTQPIPYNQIGIAQGAPRPQTAASDAISSLERIIAANRELIKNKK